MSNIYVTHLYLDMAAKSALVARYTEGVAREHKLESCRKELIAALSGCAPGDTKNAEALLKDTIANAITDSIDVDWTPDHGAESVMRELFNFGEEKNHAHDT